MATIVTPARLASLLDDPSLAGKKILSLDCFDTLLWRSTHAPIDVFADLTPEPGLRCRVFGEAFARQRKALLGRGTEVDLDEIYAELLPSVGNAATAIDAELDAEARHCFAFAPTVELMRAARRRGLKVIVVSDTYLSASQLHDLIRRAGGDEAAELIDRVFASSEHGESKTGGLFRHVLRALGVAPSSIVHVGDNPRADVEAAQRLGIEARHLHQFGDRLEQQLRLESAISGILDPSVRISTPSYQLHRAPVALGHDREDSAAWRLGYGVIGPLLAAFASWVRAEAHAVQARTGIAPRLLFLLRDGHLPEQVFSRLFGGDGIPAARVEISRFSAFASSFCDESRVMSYLTEFSGTGRFEALANQLLFTPGEARTLVERTRNAQRPKQAFVAEVRRPHNLARILARSSAYADRLLAYLRREAGVEDGRPLILVDLGYAGTVQDRVAPLLRERLGTSVEGRYLALRDVPGWRNDKRGLLDTSRYDHRAIDALCAYIAIVEQLTTAEQASVVDYTASGEPIRRSTDLKQRQSEVRAQAQRAALAFAQDFDAAVARWPSVADSRAWQTTAAGLLGRLLFLPSQEEIDLVSGFEHDVNMGVSDKVTLFDPDAARDGLLKRGLFYTNDNPRQYLPAELRGQGMPLSLSLIALRRFAPDLRHADFSDRGFDLPIMVADGAQLIQSTARAHPTHDGFYLVAVPIDDGRLSVGLNLGAAHEIVQIHSITTTRFADFMNDGDIGGERDRLADAVLEGIEPLAGDLVRCTDAQSFVFVPPLPEKERGARHVLSVVFRPLVTRTAMCDPAPSPRTESTAIAS